MFCWSLGIVVPHRGIKNKVTVTVRTVGVYKLNKAVV